jgi:Uma2 family endonuclease
MTMVVTDPWIESRLRKEREATGVDRYDEVWEGVYMMSPFPNNEHQEFVLELTAVLREVIKKESLGRVFPGVNLSDRGDDWIHNYRTPDVAVFLDSGKAEDCGTHWRGPADFLVEIVSPHDRTREKIPFYGRLGVVELLVIDRDPWQLDLYRHDAGELKLVGRSTVEGGETLESRSVPLTFQLVAGKERPQVRVEHRDSRRRWLV